MRLVQATELDSERLKDFFSKNILSGKVDLRFERHNSFFDIYKIQSDSFKTFFIENEQSEIKGMATLTFREGYIDGKLEKIGFASDLRLADDRKASIEWSKHYLNIINNELNRENCKYFFSSISTHSDDYYKMLVRPKVSRREFPRYYLLRKYNVIAIHGKTPFSHKPIKNIDITNANQSNLEEISTYLDSQSKKRPLGCVYTPQKLKKIINQWPELSIESFLIAKDSKGKIIGTCAPWSQKSLQSIFPVKYHGLSRQFRKLMNISSPFGYTHPLANINHTLDLSFLTHFHANNPDVFYSLLFNAWKNSHKKQTLIYPDFFGFSMTSPPKGFIHSKTPYQLYTVMPPHHSLPHSLRPKPIEPPPHVEVALI